MYLEEMESQSKDQEQQECMRDMVANLQARKEALEAKIHDKNQELKRLCIQEAELTGVLPPETPLEPGESPPAFRRRVGTAFTYPENLINNKLKSKEEETLAALELECKIQVGISEAALGLANDTNASKSVRRKHRLMYQQSQRRLQELEAKLEALRQSTHKSQHPKQRKKPRPPLENETETNVDHGANEVDPLLHDVGVSLSPLSPEVGHGTSRKYWDMRHSATYDASLSRHNAKDSKPGHPQLQRHGSGSYFPSGHVGIHFSHQIDYERYHMAPVPSSSHTPPNYWVLQGYERSAAHNSADLDGSIRYTAAPVSRYPPQTQVSTQSQAQARWHRERNRFGSLDRRKAPSSSHSSSSPCLESWSTDELEHHNNAKYSPNLNMQQQAHSSNFVPCQMVLGPPPTVHETRSLTGGGVALLPNQTYPEHSLGMDGHMGGEGRCNDSTVGSSDISDIGGGGNRAGGNSGAGGSGSLLRTQSLGSVDPHQTDITGRKHKEKEWYETSLDAPPTHSPQHVSHPISTSRRRSPESGGPTGSDVSSNLSRSSSNVSGDHHPQYQSHSLPKSDAFDTVVPFESPKNHTVIQAGKWQPYREVTKPFEMADFYKYSTKFRKSNGNTQDKHQQPLHHRIHQQSPQKNAAYSTGYPSTGSSNPESPTPQQKGVYQPLQPMTCQPLDPTTRNRVLSPNASVEGGLLLSTGESLADAFSSEMLAWYQDQNIPRSATLV